MKKLIFIFLIVAAFIICACTLSTDPMTTTTTTTTINRSLVQSLETMNASKWFGGDDRTDLVGRDIGTGQSLRFSNNFYISKFSVYFTDMFDYDAHPEYKGHAVTVILDIRDSIGNIIQSSDILIPASFNGGWVEFDLESKNVLINKNNDYIFTWYLKDGELNTLNSGSGGNVDNLYENGTGYNSQIYPGGDMKNFNNWGEHSWDFLFKITRKMS